MAETIRKSLRESAKTRWLAMFAVSMVLFGAYYYSYAESSIKPILESSVGWTSKDIGIYTSAYAWFNVGLFMMLISGVVLDKVGIRKTGLGASLLMVIGAAINYWAMSSLSADAVTTLPLYGPIKTQVLYSSIGFAVFGTGSEAAGITVVKAIVKWFKGKELALALGLQLSLARLGSALTLAISLPLAIKFTYKTPILMSFALMLVGFLAFIVYMVLDKKLDASEKDILVKEEEPFRLKDILLIVKNRAFWYTAILCVLFYSAVFPFLVYAPDFMVNKYHVAPKLAGLIPMLLPIGTIFLTPLFGNIYDKKGKGATIMIIGSVMLIIVHGFLAVPALNGWVFAAVLVVFLGIAFSLVPSAMWASVPKFIPEKQLGTAYAVIFYIQNIGLLAVPLILGFVLNSSNPNVAPNKALIRSSVEQSFDKALAAHNIQVNHNKLTIAIDKTTESVVDSIVQTSIYTAVPQKEINIKNLKSNIINSNLSLLESHSLSSNPKIAIKELRKIFIAATFPVVKKEKLDIRYNYENDILIFVVLGFLSVIFSFLLKAEDKKKGYGLQMPNIQKTTK